MKSDDNYKDKELLERLRRDEDVHPDEVNAFLFRSGLRRCPHSEHDSDAAIAACTGGFVGDQSSLVGLRRPFQVSQSNLAPERKTPNPDENLNSNVQRSVGNHRTGWRACCWRGESAASFKHFFGANNEK